MFDKNGFKKEDGFVTVHNYSYENDEYTGTTDEWVVAGSGIPAKSTLIAPPAAKKGYARVFSGGEWAQVKDHRGETWYTKDWQPVEIKDLGQEVGLTNQRPPEPEPLPPVIPREVTMRQARLQLHKLGMLKDVQPAIDSLEEPERTEAQIEWDYATSINRDNASVVLLIEKLGLTDEQVDEWFLEASKL